MLIDQKQLDRLKGRDQYETVNNVHAWALSHFQYATDEERHDNVEYWSSPQEIKEDLSQHKRLIDDCDGFALMCREILDQLGIKNRLVLCQVETGEGHLVCEVDGWILDNRRDDVVNFTKIKYTWHLISGYNSGDPWKEIVIE